jgi:2-polyprenyl-6-methoxyphenol hydroxylase-like FAD-dependent oxidoreductase
VTLPTSTDVLIVGAGPTGLTLACALADRGIGCVIVDKLAQGANTSRAAVIHARTLEVLETLDVSPRLVRAGHVVPRFTVRDRERVLAAITFDHLPTRYPYTLMVPQQVTEGLLEDRLRELGGRVWRGVAVQALHQDADGVTAVVEGPASAMASLRARYVVGADGMHSRVREQAGIGFVGEPYEQSFVLADVRMSWPLDRDEVMLFFSPAGLVVVAPLPQGRHRVVATLDDAPEHPGVADVQHLIDTRGPATGSATVHDVVWGSRFRVHRRLAERYRAGRVLLAGDAAHVHSPAGGQGMNTGINDAMTLAPALADAVRGVGGPDHFASYERGRRHVAEGVLRLTDRMTRAATLRTPAGRAVRNAVLAAVGRTVARRWMAAQLAGLSHG